MRLFFGLEIPANTALAIAGWRERQFPPLGRPVPMANFHITLAFVGECSEPTLDRLCRDVDERLARQTQNGASMTLSRVGYWPKAGICWLGPADSPVALEHLARCLQQSALAVGARRERRAYQPHLTLFRRCEIPPPAPTEPAEFRLGWHRFTLYESVAGRQGMHYQPLAEWPLAPGD